MPPTPQVPAAAVANLRARRRNAGLSQEALAARCGISERTIRALETGRAQRPHRDTLVAIADALGLTPAARDEFVALWRATGRRLEELFADTSPSAELRAEFFRQRSLIQELSIVDSITVDRDMRWTSQHVRRTFEVVGDGLDRFLWLKSFSSLTVDPDRFEVTGSVNVDPGPGLYLPELDAKAWEGMLRRTLRPGERYSLEYTFGHIEAARPSTLVPVADTMSLMGVTKPIRSVLLEVRFDPARLPVRVRHVRFEAVGAPEQIVADVPISPFGVAQLLMEPAGIGTHGLRWEWDVPAVL